MILPGNQKPGFQRNRAGIERLLSTSSLLGIVHKNGPHCNAYEAQYGLLIHLPLF
jgi:hypothetical protein